ALRLRRVPRHPGQKKGGARVADPPRGDEANRPPLRTTRGARLVQQGEGAAQAAWSFSLSGSSSRSLVHHGHAPPSVIEEQLPGGEQDAPDGAERVRIGERAGRAGDEHRGNVAT